MPNNQDYRDLLDEKFKGLTALMNAQFINVHDKLEQIQEQTTKTNGRVTTLEQKELTHVVNCPNIKKIDQIEEDLMEYKMAKKYPKIVVAALVIYGILTLYTAYQVFL